MNQPLESEFKLLTQQAGIVDLSGWSQIDLSGQDRVTFLHNMCTNDIRSLTPGNGCEAFLTSAQGKTLGHVFVLCGESCLHLFGAPGQADSLVSHFDRYIIREEVELLDQTGTQFALLLAGTKAETVLDTASGLPMPVNPLEHLDATIGGCTARVIRFDFGATPACWIVGSKTDQEKIVKELIARGASLCDATAFESLRVESGLPLFGIDFTSDNLPQEVVRDSHAISFTKGCYIGQETVARIDAMGHVNQHLAGVRLLGETLPQAGTDLIVDDKPVGKVTSAVWSPSLFAPLALAMIRRAHGQPGTKLDSSAGEAEVVTLPVETTS